MGLVVRAAQPGVERRPEGATGRNLPRDPLGRAGQEAADAPRVPGVPTGDAARRQSAGSGRPGPAGTPPGRRAGTPGPAGPVPTAGLVGRAGLLGRDGPTGPRGTCRPDRKYPIASLRTSWIRRCGPSCAPCPVILLTRWHAGWWP